MFCLGGGGGGGEGGDKKNIYISNKYNTNQIAYPGQLVILVDSRYY